jgi:hypothetical protein
MSKKPIIITIISLVVIALIGGGAVWYLNKYQISSNKGQVTKNNGQENTPEIGNQNQPSTIENQKSEIININDWLTYRNEEYGFEVKYPKEWRTAVCGIACQGFGPRNHPEDISVAINVLNLSLLEAQKSLPVLTNTHNHLIRSEYITIKDSKWLKLTIEQDISKTTFVHHLKEFNGKTYEVGVGTDEFGIVKIYNIIFSTFKFLN